jgi:hypothetical protein
MITTNHSSLRHLAALERELRPVANLNWVLAPFLAQASRFTFSRLPLFYQCPVINLRVLKQVELFDLLVPAVYRATICWWWEGQSCWVAAQSYSLLVYQSHRGMTSRIPSSKSEIIASCAWISCPKDSVSMRGLYKPSTGICLFHRALKFRKVVKCPSSGQYPQKCRLSRVKALLHEWRHHQTMLSRLSPVPLIADSPARCSWLAQRPKLAMHSPHRSIGGVGSCIPGLHLTVVLSLKRKNFGRAVLNFLLTSQLGIKQQGSLLSH